MIYQKIIKVGVTIFTCLLFVEINSVNCLPTNYQDEQWNLNSIQETNLSTSAVSTEIIIKKEEAGQLTTEKSASTDDITTIIQDEATTSYYKTEYTTLKNSVPNDEEQTTLSVTTELSMTTNLPTTTELTATTNQQLSDKSTDISMTEGTTESSQDSTTIQSDASNEAPQLLIKLDDSVTEKITTSDEIIKSKILPVDWSSSDMEDYTTTSSPQISKDLETQNQTDKNYENTTTINNENNDEIIVPAIDEKQQLSSNVFVENQTTEKNNKLINKKNEKEEISSTDIPTTTTSTTEDFRNYE